MLGNDRQSGHLSGYLSPKNVSLISLFSRAKARRAFLASALLLLSSGWPATPWAQPSSPASDVTHLRIAAEQGNADAQFLLGIAFAYGEGVPRDDRQAVAWWHRAAVQGLAVAQSNLGRMHELGRGTKRNYSEAAAWFRKAASQGNADAQNNLGVMYEKGRGNIRKNEVEAVTWYRKAADQGNAVAQYNLAWMYHEGRGLGWNDAQALAWFRKSAEQGYADAQNSLAVMYGKGRGGLPRNLNLAVYWWVESAKQGNENAVKNLRILSGGESRWNEAFPFVGLPAQTSFFRSSANVGFSTSVSPTQADPTGVPRDVNFPSHGPPFLPNASRVPLVLQGGIFTVDVRINDLLTLRFNVDSGSADVTIPADVVMTLYRTGTITDGDFLGEQQYQLADGSVIKSRTFRIRTLTVGNHTLTNVRGSVADVNGALLLGQSFLTRFRSWSIDNEKHELILEPRTP